MSAFRNLDWKIIVIGLLPSYVGPTLLLPILRAVIVNSDGLASNRHVLLVHILLSAYCLVVPLATGYYIAKFAENRPRLHVLLVVIFSFPAVALLPETDLVLRFTIGALWLAFSSTGSFLQLRFRST